MRSDLGHGVVSGFVVRGMATNHILVLKESTTVDQQSWNSFFPTPIPGSFLATVKVWPSECHEKQLRFLFYNLIEMTMGLWCHQNGKNSFLMGMVWDFCATLFASTIDICRAWQIERLAGHFVSYLRPLT